MSPNPTGTDELLDGDAPLSTFSARINLVYRLGLIQPDLVRELHLVRKIRNVFAHELTGATLNEGSHKDRIKELLIPFQNNEAFKKLRKVYFKDVDDPSTNFKAIVALLILRLENVLESTTTLSNKDACKLLPEIMRAKE
ncbi:hypothetical protein ISS37_03175 [candidate division KSB1 bacterium]|nr:hypothetical protein [candidate division KSB1 bacterium]